MISTIAAKCWQCDVQRIASQYSFPMPHGTAIVVPQRRGSRQSNLKAHSNRIAVLAEYVRVCFGIHVASI